MEEDALVPIEPQAEEKKEEVKLDEAIVWALSSQQIRYCELSAKTRHTKAEIAKIVRTSKSKLSQWDEDPNVQAYIHYLKKSTIEDHRESAKRQMTQVRDRIFADLLARMEMDGEDIIDSEEFKALPPTLQKIAMERHQHFMSFKDAAKVMMDLNKSLEGMAPEEKQEETNEFVNAILTRAHMRMTQRRSTEDIFEKSGINREDRYKVIEMNKDGTVKQPVENKTEGIEELLEVDITTITINRNNNKEK